MPRCQQTGRPPQIRKAVNPAHVWASFQAPVSQDDPREVDDLLKNRGSLSEAAAIRMFINAFYGALKGMAES